MNVDYSNKLKRIPSYLFAEIDRAIEKKKKEGKDIINLSVGDPDLPAPKRVVDAL
ncbi:MAG TPA: LL-diaminopimelate aminotransferase, partial [Candidatus Altiarchaeales archaeon]|nr:LL-diaminopimelate aminotransferase [Candidatus Altiarchaeales archaeon]